MEHREKVKVKYAVPCGWGKLQNIALGVVLIIDIFMAIFILDYILRYGQL